MIYSHLRKFVLYVCEVLLYIISRRFVATMEEFIDYVEDDPPEKVGFVQMANFATRARGLFF